MTLSKRFLVIGASYLVLGILIGMYMGGSQTFTLAPLHAHINLLGFTLMTLFGIVYRIIPKLAEGTLAKVHFWLFQLGVVTLLALLYLLLSQSGPPEVLGPLMLVSEIAVLVAILSFLANLWQNA